MKPRATHTQYTKGKRIYVIMRDGTRFTDRYKETKSGRIKFENRTVRTRDIRVATYAK